MKKKFVAALTAAMLAMTAFTGCGEKPAEQAPVTEATKEEAKTEAPVKVSEEAVEKYILGITDRFILEGAKDIDFLSKKESVDKVITKVEADDSAVDTSKPGTYKVRYTVTVNVRNLEKAEAYVAEHPEALEAHAVTAQEPASGQGQEEEAAKPGTETEKDEQPAPAELSEGAEDPEAPADGAEPSDSESETTEAPAAEKAKDGQSETAAGANEETHAEAPADPATETPAGGVEPSDSESETTEAPAAEKAEDGQSETAAGANEETHAEAPADPAAETSAGGKEEGQAQEPAADPVLPSIPDEVFDEDPAASDPGAPAETVEIVIEKEITVVTPEEAVEIIKDGGEVWTDGSTPATVEDITGGEASQAGTTKPAEVIEPAAETDKDTSDEQAAPEQYDEDDDEQESSGSGSQSSHSSDSEPSHTHNWVEETETVYHEEKGHYESVKVGTKTIVDEEAWDEDVYIDIDICSACGYRTTSDDDMIEHIADVHDCEASYGLVSEVVDTIHHPAVTHEEDVYEDQWVVDSEAWNETVVTGYYCPECGAHK